MRLWTMLGALMLVLLLWTGGMAHAAERVDCIPASESSIVQHGSDRDEIPAGPEQGAAHHHSGCSGHHLVAPAVVTTVNVPLPARDVPFAWREAGVPGRDPDSLLRPPIA